MIQESRIEDLLQLHFKTRAFRQFQRELVIADLAGRDILAVLPTGYGKSLCFQLPALVGHDPKITLVVSPLISLMRDQVRQARHVGVPAACLHSGQDARAAVDVVTACRDGRVRLLYVSPERVMSHRFQWVLSQMPQIRRVVFDEAHCLSMWGAEFRAAYYQAAEYTSQAIDAPVSAFTATATMTTQTDILTRLAMHNPMTVVGDMNRRNLYYQVTPKHGDGTNQISEYIETHPDQCGIVYRTTRAQVENTTKYLVRCGLHAVAYHAGLERRQRAEAEADFLSGRVNCIVATIAFGLGINKPDIRWIIHADVPKNIEGYYQETGRAGRDGQPAHCLFLFSTDDIPRVRQFIDRQPDPVTRDTSYQQLIQMVQYAQMQATCRRVVLLKYFGQTRPARCMMCDVCV